MDERHDIYVVSEDDKYSLLYRAGYAPGPTGALWRFLAARLNRPFSGLKVLDAGCGSGMMVRRFCDEGAEAHGVDISQEAVRQAVGLDLEGHVSHESITNLPVGAGDRFDLVWCCDVLEHLPVVYVPTALAELRRVGKRLFASICLRESGWKGRKDLHLTVRPAKWWLEQVRDWYIRVESERDGCWLFVDAA